jgi:hypothetical protein
MNFPPVPPQIPRLTNAEIDELTPIVIEQYLNMTPYQKNMDGHWHTRVNGHNDIRMSRRPGKKTGNNGLSKNIVIRRQMVDNYVGPFDVVFNTDDLPQQPYQDAQGGKKSRKTRRNKRKSRRTRRKTIKSRKHR